MPAVGTDGDGLGVYLTGASADGGLQADQALSLGGFRSSTEVRSLLARRSNAVRGLVIEHVSGLCGPGLGTLASGGGDLVRFAAPGEGFGADEPIAAGETRVVASAVPGKFVRVRRRATGDISGSEALTLVDVLHNSVAQGVIADALASSGGATYRALMLRVNEDLETVVLNIPTLADPEDSDVGQLGASGAGTIETSGSFATWPRRGFALILEQMGGYRELVYYGDRTADTLIVAASGRGLGASSPAAGAATDAVYPVPGYRIGIETPVSGEIQTIANETTAPSAVTFSEFGTASLGPFTAGDLVGLWVERLIPAGMVGDPASIARIDWTITHADLSSWTGAVRGRHRVANTALARYEAYLGVDAFPDVTSAPAATSATLPIVLALTADARNQVIVRRRNQYNLVSENLDAQSFDLDAGGELEVGAPSAPIHVGAEAAGGGQIRVEALYSPLVDAASERADTWAIWLAEGVDPDPSDPETALVAMTGGARDFQRLDHTPADSFVDGADVRVLVRARRAGPPEKDSTNTDIVSVEAETLGPSRPFGGAFLDDRLAIVAEAAEGPTSPADDYVIDAGEDIRIELTSGSAALYWGLDLIWRYLVSAGGETGVLYVPSGWSQDVLQAPTDPGAGLPFAVIDTSPRQLTIDVGGVQRMLIDVDAQVFGYHLEDFATAFTGVSSPEGALATGGAAYFQVWNAWSEQWETYMRLDADGTWRVKGTADFSLSQAAIEAL